MTLRTARRGSKAGNQFWGCIRYPGCKGLRGFETSLTDRPSASEASTAATRQKGSSATTPDLKTISSARKGGRPAKRLRLNRGDLLVSNANTLGPGKLVAVDGDDLVLEYFDTPGQDPDDRTRLSVPRRGLQRFALQLETRVFWMTAATWRSGRVIETTPDRDILVRTRDGERYVPEPDLYVRWHRPLTDPVGFATGPLLESPLLADLRRPFLQAILQQRSAARGMKGALSSSIELHDHQLEAAWRVLQDPVQRYLLADEVGLGKTIETGIILRQLLLDHPDLTVQLILPPFLIGQWQHELTDKFFIQDFPEATLRFARNDEPHTWAPADLLIIDEAHHLAALADNSHPDLAARYVRLAKTARQSPRLLMLSATPALNNEPVFLEMLKLLDPAVYTDVSVDELRHRLASRAGLGRIFLGLQPHVPAVLLRNRLTEVRNALSGDTEIEQHLKVASSALETNDRDTLKAAIESMRTHVAEIYRVHRRMLRTRRTAALETTYRVTGRSAPHPLTLNSELLTDTTRLLEVWRQEALAAHEDDPTALRSAARAFAKAVNLAFDPEALAEWARTRAAATIGEQTALERIAQDLGFTQRRNAVARPIADALSYRFKTGEKAVVFCPTTDLVTELADELRAFLPSTRVLEHRATDTPEHIESVIRTFENARDTAILIADSSAEEGRNFQFANLLVHVGVPSNANRMEQRIGRCDRWQMNDAGAGWNSLAVTEANTAETFTSAWTRILEDGFQIFDSSIATLQFAVEAATDRAWQQLFTDGIEAMEVIIAAVRSCLQQEVERVREQDALDSIESAGERGSIYGQLAEAESGEDEFAELTHDLLATNRVPGNLRFGVIGDPVHGVGGYDAFARLPGQQLQLPLVSLERWKRDFLPISDQRGTYRRSVAIEHRGTHLYRYGDPFIDAISDFLWHDDRGRAFGMWRWLPDWGYGELIAYRFDYAVEALPRHPGASYGFPGQELEEGSVADRVALQHRADGLFPPLIVTVWVDAQGRQLTDSALLDVLEAPYVKPRGQIPGGDYSLNRSRIDAAYRFVPATQWSTRWHGAEATAKTFVKSLSEVQDSITTGFRHARESSAKRVKQLQMRAARAVGSERLALEREVASEQAVGQILTEAIATPKLRLDSTGIVIVSGEKPAIGEDV